MEEIYVESAHKLYELAINVLQGLVVRLKRFDQLRLGVDDFLRHDRIAYPFKTAAPLSNVRAFMWCTQKQYAVCRHENGA